MTDRRTKSQLRPKIILDADNKDDETLVPCPICKKGMIHPDIRNKVNELLYNASEEEIKNKQSI